MVMRCLMPLLHKQQRVLEINCGTGHDAITLAPHVGHYLATDISEQMISCCRAKQLEQKTMNLCFKTMAIQNLRDELGETDLLFSNFGGLNCLSPDEFKAFARTCAAQMPSGSEVFLVIMGRCCLWEQFYFLVKGALGKAFRRLKNVGTGTQIADTTFLTWYYSPREVRRFFSPEFALVQKHPIALFVPPSYLEPFFAKRPALLQLLNRIDRLFITFGFLANFADHYCLRLKKHT